MSKPVVPYQTGPSVWYGSSMKHSKAEWLWQFSKHEILELEKAAELPIHRYTQREAAAIFYGIGLHIGNPRSQNAKGHIIGHVKDIGVSSSDPNVRIYQTRERQTFHTDST